MTPITLRLADDTLDAVDDLADERGLQSRSEAARLLITRGLEHESTDMAEVLERLEDLERLASKIDGKLDTEQRHRELAVETDVQRAHAVSDLEDRLEWTPDEPEYLADLDSVLQSLADNPQGLRRQTIIDEVYSGEDSAGEWWSVMGSGLEAAADAGIVERSPSGDAWRLSDDAGHAEEIEHDDDPPDDGRGEQTPDDAESDAAVVDPVGDTDSHADDADRPPDHE